MLSKIQPLASGAPSLSLSGGLGELIRIYSQPGENFGSEAEMREWLSRKGVDCEAADGKKGLDKLFDKIKKGEARLVYDSRNAQVIRAARVAKASVEATIHGHSYPLVELCQIFLRHPVTREDLQATRPDEVARILAGMQIRSAQVRNSQQLWETLLAKENPREGVRRGLREELGLSESEVSKADVTMLDSSMLREEAIDWPGIDSVLQLHEALAKLPEEISKPVYVELEAADQITIFVAAPNTPVLRSLLGLIIPKIQYVP